MAGRIASAPAAFIGEEIGGVIDDDVLHQIHAGRVDRVRQPLVVVERAEMAVHFQKILCPVTVVATRLCVRVPPQIGYRRCDPDCGRAQAAYVCQLLLDSLEITTVVLGIARRIEFAGAQIVVGGIAVTEAIGHQEVDDLVAPVG